MATIFTVPGCSKCALLKRKADELGFEYTESHNVDEVISAGFHSAPVMKFDGKFYAFKDALELLKTVGA